MQRQHDEITASAPQSGRFTPVDSAINRFDLKFRKQAGATGDATLLVRLWQGEEQERLVFDAQQPVAGLADGQEVTWYFAPEQTAPGQTYIWEVSAANGEAQTGVGLCMAEDGQPALAVYGQVWTEVFENGIFYQQRSAPMPRAYVVYAAETVAGDPQAVERLLSPDFDLRNTALVAQPLDLPATATRPASRATMVEYGQTTRGGRGYGQPVGPAPPGRPVPSRLAGHSGRAASRAAARQPRHARGSAASRPAPGRVPLPAQLAAQRRADQPGRAAGPGWADATGPAATPRRRGRDKWTDLRNIRSTRLSQRLVTQRLAAPARGPTRASRLSTSSSSPAWPRWRPF